MNVSAIIVTRGNVDLAPVLDSLPDEWEKLVWDNGEKACYREPPPNRYWNADDLSVYGRYAAIEYASHDLIFVQDDDVIVSDPDELRRTWESVAFNLGNHDFLVANMPQEFRPHYPDSCLVGFGACFHRDTPARAFGRFFEGNPARDLAFNRCCDVVFTTLTPRVLVDVPKENLPYATDASRMYRQSNHVGERARMLELCRRVRDS